MGKHRVIAKVFDKRKRLLAEGVNSYKKTNPLMRKAMEATGAKNWSYLHAEVAALLKVKDWTKAHSIEIYRFTKDGLPALAKPCTCCQWVIEQAGIKPWNIHHT